MQIVTVVGARPQFVKAAVVSRVLRSTAGIEEVLIHTGQHYDYNLSATFFEELEIPAPEYELGIGSAPHGAQTGRMLEAIEQVLMERGPDWVLVYGDTNSTLAGALAAAKLHFRVAHVEAGLRSFNRRMPEEINRVLTDHLAEALFAPTEAAVKHLHHEGIEGRKIHLVGDVMHDVALHYAAKAEGRTEVLAQHGVAAKQYVLVTIHRAENTDDPSRLGTIMDALAEVAREIPVVFPAHPRTRAALRRSGWHPDGATPLGLVEPVGYLEMVVLEKNAALIVTDSGGVQKEAYFYRVPCVTVRDETEWTELVELGANRLCTPRSREPVIRAVHAGLSDGFPRQHSSSLYGSGDAAIRIASLLQGYQ